MESNKNDNNNGIDNKHEQPPRSERKCKLNELTNDEDKPAEAAGQEDQERANSKKNREEGNDLLDLKLENLSREELIKMVRKQMQILDQNDETIKQLETTKKEGEENANRQTEEFSQRIVQLEQEKAEVHEDLHQKMAEIVELHKELVEKSEEVAEKAKQIDALLMQLKLNEPTREQQQHLIPSDERQMKIQLSLETWFDWLEFVSRRQLAKIVPKIGDRKFGSIIQKFLHEYGEIMIEDIRIVAPYEEDSDGPHPLVRVWPKYFSPRPLIFEMAESKMPANIKNFDTFELSYLDQSVLNFMQKFYQNGLLDNVNLRFSSSLSKAIIQQVLCHLLPLIKGIAIVDVEDSAKLVDFYDDGNSKQIYEMNMKMMEKTRLLSASYDRKNLQANEIELYCRWLYQKARADGKPRVLLIEQRSMDSAPISLFIDRIKQDFLMAKNPISFFIRINLPIAFQPLEDICLDNGKTKERLLTKMKKTWRVKLLISRYPLASTKTWIEKNEKGIKNWWEPNTTNCRTICLTKELKVVAI